MIGDEAGIASRAGREGVESSSIWSVRCESELGPGAVYRGMLGAGAELGRAARGFVGAGASSSFSCAKAAIAVCCQLSVPLD